MKLYFGVATPSALLFKLFAPFPQFASLKIEGWLYGLGMYCTLTNIHEVRSRQPFTGMAEQGGWWPGPMGVRKV